MNKITLISLIACALAAPSVMAEPSGPVGGVIKFDGLVVANSCIIDNGDEDKTIKLVHVINTEINSDDAVKVKNFSIKVKNCYVANNAAPELYWSYAGRVDSKGYMLHRDENSGSNAALVLMNSSGGKIDMRKSGEGFTPGEINRGNYSHGEKLTYNFKVGYIKSSDLSNDLVTPGPILTQANYTVQYK